MSVQALAQEVELRKTVAEKDQQIKDLEKMLAEASIGEKPLFKKHGHIEHHAKAEAPGVSELRIRSSAGTVAMRNLLMPTVTVDVTKMSFEAKSFNVYSLTLTNDKLGLKLYAVGCALSGKKMELLIFSEDKELVDPQGMPCFSKNTKWKAHGVTWQRTAINLERLSPMEIRQQFYQDIDQSMKTQQSKTFSPMSESGSSTPSFVESE